MAAIDGARPEKSALRIAAMTLTTRLHPAWVILGGGMVGILLTRWVGEPAP